MWATSFNTAGGTGNFSIITGVAETFSGKVIVSGVHQGTTDFGGITEVSPDDELFLVELDRNSGATNWAVTLAELVMMKVDLLALTLWVTFGKSALLLGHLPRME